MKIMIYKIVLLLMFALSDDAIGFDIPPDSTSAKKKNSNFKLTTRIHSMGLFNYSGRLSSNNPAFDLNVTYDRHSWGFMVFDVIDLYDKHSSNNFTLALLYKRIRLGNRVTITPNTGFAVEEYGKGKGDRHILITALKVNKKLTIDNSMLFANVLMEREGIDWVNRFRVLYTADDHIDFTFSLWHNNKIFDNSDYVSSALNITYSKIKLSDHVMLSTGVTGIVMASTSDEEMFPKKNGMVFTIAAIFD